MSEYIVKDVKKTVKKFVRLTAPFSYNYPSVYQYCETGAEFDVHQEGEGNEDIFVLNYLNKRI